MDIVKLDEKETPKDLVFPTLDAIDILVLAGVVFLCITLCRCL